MVNKFTLGSDNDLLCLRAVFEPFQDAKNNMLLPKVAFVALNLAAMGLGLWKVWVSSLQALISISLCFKVPVCNYIINLRFLFVIGYVAGYLKWWWNYGGS